jgi:hypothetical protein
MCRCSSNLALYFLHAEYKQVCTQCDTVLSSQGQAHIGEKQMPRSGMDPQHNAHISHLERKRDPNTHAKQAQITHQEPCDKHTIHHTCTYKGQAKADHQQSTTSQWCASLLLQPEAQSARHSNLHASLLPRKKAHDVQHCSGTHKPAQNRKAQTNQLQFAGHLEQ